MLGIGALAAIIRISGHPPRPALNLRAADEDGRVRIEWDQFARPVISAQNASLLIADGDQRLETTLSPDLLHHGNLVYYRKSQDVEIRLRIHGATSEPVQAITRLIGLPGPRAIPIEPQSPIGRARPSRLNEPTVKKPAPVYRGPMTGRVIWTGRLAARSALRIDGDRASTGNLTGNLPNEPIKIRVYPAIFSGGAINAFARELPAKREMGEQPGPGKGGTRTVYKRNPKRAGDVVVTEIPSARNNWKTIGLRAADRALSVIVLDWEVLPREPQP